MSESVSHSLSEWISHCAEWVSQWISQLNSMKFSFWKYFKNVLRNARLWRHQSSNYEKFWDVTVVIIYTFNFYQITFVLCVICCVTFLNFAALDPMNYFLLDALTGELRTAKPLDREALDNQSGILTFLVKVMCYHWSLHRLQIVLLFQEYC